MDKNTIIGFLLIAALLFGYSWLNQPTPEELAQARYNDSIAMVQARELQSMLNAEQKPAEELLDSATIDAKIKSKFGVFSNASQGESEKITLSNDLLEVQFDSKGGVPVKATLKEYSRYDSLPVVLFDETDNKLGFIFKPSGRVISTNDLYFVPQQTSDSTLLMTLFSDAGSTFTMKYTLPSDSYMLDVQVMQEGMEDVLPHNLTNLDFVWEDYLRREIALYIINDQEQR